MLLLFISTQSAPASAGYVNFAEVLGDLWPPLNATSQADAVFWTESELYAWLDESVKQLARKLVGFVVYDTSLATIASQGDYALPTGHIHTLQADVNGTVLKPRNVQELEALDANWPSAAAGEPKAFVEDTHGLERLTLYPAPNVANESLPIGLLMSEQPAEVTQANAILSAPPVLQDYFAFSALAEARSKESNASMDETATWFKSVAGQLAHAAMELWG